MCFLHGFTARGGFYGVVDAAQLSSMFNLFWQGTTPRIFGTVALPVASALEIAAALAATSFDEIQNLPDNTVFLAEKRSRGIDNYMTVLFRPNHIDEFRRALLDSSLILKNPLCESREDFR
jgi:hypothetical protein